MMKKISLFAHKFLYVLTVSSGAVPWGFGMAGWYYYLYNSHSGEYQWLQNHDYVASYFMPLLAFSLPFIFIMIIRWLPTYVDIPPRASGPHPLNGKVRFSVSSVLEQPGDIILAYNRNNIAGGKYTSSAGQEKVPNLMAAFMNRYFGDGTQTNISFDWDLFKSCYDSPSTKAYYCNEEGKLCEIDKYSVALKSACHSHVQGDQKLDPYHPEHLGSLFPEGTVIALKLPPGVGRQYAFLLCSTEYDLQNGTKAISSLETLEACLTTVWKVIDRTPDVDPIHTCIPLLGRGTSGLNHVYGVLWTILFSYRKSVTGRANPEYSINICLRSQEMTHNHVRMHELSRFLTYALRG